MTRRTWLVIAAALMLVAALGGLGSVASASFPNSPSASVAQSVAEQSKGEQPFDCAQISALGLEKQTNLRAYELLKQCGKGEAPKISENPASDAVAAINNNSRQHVFFDKIPLAQGTPTPTVTGTPPTSTPTRTRTNTPTNTPPPTPCFTLPYNFTTATATIVPGTTDTGNHCDDCTTTVALPFPFRLDDWTFNSVTLSSNGNAQFVGSATDYSNVCMPVTTPVFQYTIFAYWDDLRTDAANTGIFTSVSGTAPNRIFNIEWRTILFTAGAPAYFELRLYEGITDSRFDVIYGQTPGNTSATGGVQLNQARYTQAFCNGQGQAVPAGTMLAYRQVPCVPNTPGTPTTTITVTAGTGTATRTGTAQVTSTAMPSMTITMMPTMTGTAMPTMTSTTMPTMPTMTRTGTAIPSVTITMIPTMTGTSTVMPTMTQTGTAMPSMTGTVDATMTGTMMPTMTSTIIPTTISTGTMMPTMTRTAIPCNGRVTVCHRTGNGNSHAISISCSALQAHMNHGDTVGACAASTPGPPTSNFRDVTSGDYFYDHVLDLAEAGAVGGYNDGTFRPYNQATRAQLVKIVVLAFDIPLYNGSEQSFSDVPRDHPFYQHIMTAKRDNIISGYQDGTFRPYANVTRGQIAKIAVESARMGDLSSDGPSFRDVPTNHTFFRYIETAYAHGILSGYADGTFRSESDATRGQITKIINLATHP